LTAFIRNEYYFGLRKLTAVFLPLDLLKAALLLPVIRVIRARGGLVPGR